MWYLPILKVFLAPCRLVASSCHVCPVASLACSLHAWMQWPLLHLQVLLWDPSKHFPRSPHQSRANKQKINLFDLCQATLKPPVQRTSIAAVFWRVLPYCQARFLSHTSKSLMASVWVALLGGTSSWWATLVPALGTRALCCCSASSSSKKS